MLEGQGENQGDGDQVSAPLIVDLTAGSTTCEMKDVCRKFEAVTGMTVVIQERAGDAVKYVAKAEPLRIKSGDRN